MRYLIALICYFLITFPAFATEEDLEELLLSTPDQVATLASEPNYLVGGLINPLSGQLALRQVDLVVKGAQNILLSRIYIPPYIPNFLCPHKHNKEEWNKLYLYRHLSKNYKGWQFFPPSLPTLYPQLHADTRCKSKRHHTRLPPIWLKQFHHPNFSSLRTQQHVGRYTQWPLRS